MSAGASAGSSSRCRSSSSSSSSSHGSSAEDARDAARRQAWFATVDRRQEQQEQLAASVEAGHTAVAAGQAAAAVVPVVAADFDSAGAFDGFRLGWVFKAGPNGLGYYRDYGPDADGVPKAAPLTPTASSAASAELFGYLDSARSHAGRGGDGGAGVGEVMWGLDTAAAAGVGGVKLGALARAEDGLLGRGAQSQVLLYRHLDPPPGFRGMLQYGVKAIAKAGLSARAASRALEEKAALVAAAAAWAGRPGKSPIVRLCGTGQDETALYLITEFLSKGTLTELAPVPPSLARYYVGALAVALEQSHALGFVHRDIKLDNVLLDGDAVPRLIDFGLCRRLRRGERASSLVGTLGCAAPEVLAGLPYGHAAEWWSVGVALHHLLLGAPPFDPGAGPAMEPGGWGATGNREALESWAARTSGGALAATLGASVQRIQRACADERNDGAGVAAALDAGAVEIVLRGLLMPEPGARLCAARGLQELKETAWFEGFEWAELEAGRLLPPEQTFSFNLPGAMGAMGGDGAGAQDTTFEGF